MEISCRYAASAAAAFALLVLANTNARAGAVVTHIYDLNGSYADSLDGPDLVPNGGTLGPTGYTFGFGQGPGVRNAIHPSSYSIEALFWIDQMSGYRRLLCFKGLVSDTGLYTHNGDLIFYNTMFPGNSDFTPGVMTHLVVTRDGATSQFLGYVNGIPQLSFIDSGELAVFSEPDRVLHFFRDDGAVGGENASGFVDGIRLYDGVLSAAEVLALSQGGAPPGLAQSDVPEPGTWALLAFGVLAALIRRQRQQAGDFRRENAG